MTDWELRLMPVKEFQAFPSSHLWPHTTWGRCHRWCNSICVLRGHWREPWQRALSMAAPPQTLLTISRGSASPVPSITLAEICWFSRKCGSTSGKPAFGTRAPGNVAGTRAVIFLYYLTNCQLFYKCFLTQFQQWHTLEALEVVIAPRTL